jgi:hypothetical protein
MMLNALPALVRVALAELAHYPEGGLALNDESDSYVHAPDCGVFRQTIEFQEPVHCTCGASLRWKAHVESLLQKGATAEIGQDGHNPGEAI